MLLFLLAACGSPDAPPAPGPTAWTWDGQAAERVALPATDLDAGLSELVEVLAGINPVEAHAGHAWAMGYADSGCPVMDEHNGQDLWWGDCETDDGSRFQGFSLYTRARGFAQDAVWVDHYYWAHSHMVVQPNDGGTYLALGDCEVRGIVTPDNLHEQWVYLLGDYRWDAPAADGGWIQDDLSLWLYLIAREHEDGRSLLIDGGASHLPGTFSAVEVTNGMLMDTPDGCPLEPSGTWSVWEPEGGWYEVAFDGADEAGQATAACDGCGVVTWRGEEVGPACADFSPLNAWSSVDWKW